MLEEVEKKYADAKTLTADFTQLTTSASLGQTKTSSGKIFLKRPSKVRWETENPDKNLLVSDGSRFSYYTPPFDIGEKGQVLEKKSSEVQSKLANALLSGSFSMARDMKIKMDGKNTFLLTPKKGSAGTVKRAKIEVNPEEKLIQKVILDHEGGNHAEISLTHIELGKKLQDQLFEFQIPPNTDKVTE